MISDNNSQVAVLDKDRLRKLYEYEILDTISEKRFDALVDLAAMVCGKPISLISLIDDRRQWFKSKVGIDVQETAVDLSFCRYALCGMDVLEVCDASLDPRFSNNPYVTGAPNIRYYCGAPLISPDGYNLGTLCVMDDKPGALGDAQKAALSTLAYEVVAQLELSLQKRKLEDENQKLVALNRELNDFAYIVSHDLKAPLRGIRHIADWLQEDLEPINDIAAGHLKLLRQKVNAMNELIEGVLEYSRAGRSQDKISFIDSKIMVQDIFSQIAGKDDRLIFEGDMPMIQCDAFKLGQVLLNLMNNGLIHNKSTRKVLTLSAHKNDEGMVNFSVGDNGKGIRAEFHDIIFQLFRRLDVETDGTGVGLAIVRKLIDQVGGEVSVSSDPGKGSIFRFSWPLTR